MVCASNQDVIWCQCSCIWKALCQQSFVLYVCFPTQFSWTHWWRVWEQCRVLFVHLITAAFYIFKKRSWCWWGWTKFGGWGCSSTSFVGLDFLPSFCKCSAPLNMFTIICGDEFCCLRCNVSGQRWAVTLPIRDKDFPPLYRFDCCRFPNAVSCCHCITPTEGMNSWKIPSYVFNPGSGFSNVSACLLSIWWNHVHRGSQFRRKKTTHHQISLWHVAMTACCVITMTGSSWHEARSSLG